MKQHPLISPTPWDAAVFGMPTWELLDYSEVALQQARLNAGHYSIKIDPLADKRLLHDYGFYYCDTLIEPYCNAARLRLMLHADAHIAKESNSGQLLPICHGAFVHGRFHRDFNLAKEASNLRYDNWLLQLIEKRQVYSLYWQDGLAGFIAFDGNNLVLHALANEYRGKGYSKYWWSAVCNELLANGNDEVKSSISATNLAVFKLYASLGFSFNKPYDVYHCLSV